jgi:membrane protease YdiL (CAAX protease family)
MNRPWRKFAIFYSLTLVLLALVPVLSFAFGTSMDFGALAARASEETGVPWTSNLFDVVRLCFAEPGLWLLLLGGFVPTLAAGIMLATTGGALQWRRFVRRLRPFGESQQSMLQCTCVYVVLCLGMLVGLFLVFQLREAISPGQYEQVRILSIPSLLMTILFAALLDQGAVLEEAGWRGYATPLLQDHAVTPLVVAIVVGIAWSFWHLPRDIISDLPGKLGVATYLFLYLPAFTLGTVTTSVIAVYFMNRLGGSLIPAIMVHGLGNDAMGFSGLATIERALTPYHQITKAIPFVILCILIIRLGGARLALREEHTANTQRMGTECVPSAIIQAPSSGR